MAIRLNERQQQAAMAGVCCAVVASAGTGKTGTLTERYLAELAAGKSPLEIVAVTFTEKAAGELRERIRKAIEQTRGSESDAVAELDIAPIGTIHSLCGRICREHPDAAEVAPGFTVLADAEGPLFRQEHLDDLLVGLGADVYDPTELSYGTARAAVAKLLDEPHLAAEALALCDQPWDDARAALESQLSARRADFLASEAWRTPADAVRGAAWPAGGPLAERLAVLQLHLAALEAGGDFAATITTLAGSKLGNVGGNAAKELRQSWNELPKAAEAGVKAGLAADIGPLDEALWRSTRRLKQIYEAVAAELWQRMQRHGVLDFAGLEIGALRALQQRNVQLWYRQRWSVLLVDETQDVNRTQSELIEALIGLFDGPSVCLVGDAKQSIYGFRGAAVEEFERLEQRLIGDAELRGRRIELDQTYRQHRDLAGNINTLFAPILNTLHAEVTSAGEPPHDADPYLELAIVQDPDPDAPKASVRRRRWVEANWVAERIRQFIDDGTLVSTRSGPQPAGYEHVAVLSRAWATLDFVQEALAARGIPSVHGGGGSLLDTREAKDGLALLRFLAHPDDNLALAAVLRAPWFAVSDPELVELAKAANRESWWAALKQSGLLAHPAAVLAELLKRAETASARELLQAADRLTGFTAVLANLPLGDRRMADWRAFEDLVAGLASSGPHVFQVYRRLLELVDLEVEIRRPVVEARGAVSLLTIHASKGLEYPIVFVPDLARRSPSPSDAVLLDRELGVAVRPPTRDDGARPQLWQALMAKATERSEAEERRLLYVACTRAGTRLVLSAAPEKADRYDGAQSLLKVLASGWDTTGWPVDEIPYNPAMAVPPTVPAPTPKSRPANAVDCLSDPGPCLDRLPVSSLDTYRRCPRAFRYQQIDNSPGIYTGENTGATDIGTLVHDAIQHGLETEQALREAQPQMPDQAIRQAAELVQVWRTSPKFSDVRGERDQLEVDMTHPIGAIVLNGRIDRVGQDYVVDYKTGAHVDVNDHELQVWAYARAKEVDQGYIADLRGPKLIPIDAARLAELDQEAERVAAAIADNDFPPDPEPDKCRRCPYLQCEHRPTE